VGASLIIAWGLSVQPLSAVVFVLVLTALSAVRYRFAPYKWVIPVEAALSVLYSLHWLPALLGLWLPIIGLLENKWHTLEEQILSEIFEVQAQRLKLEKQRENVTLAAANSVKLAEINERARIAQEIHDHVGHEITGALIALQTAASLHDSGDERAGKLLGSTIARLESASVTLRETVYNLKPAKSGSDLEDLCAAFAFCRIEFASSVDSAEHSEILAANLKEALTNISRHSNATHVTVRLDENDGYIRMVIADDGRQATNNIKTGLGMAGMKERVRKAGGSFTLSTDGGFKITQILPKKSYAQEEGTHEITYS